MALKQVGGGHQAVADGLDLLEAMLVHQRFAVFDQTIEIGDHLLGRMRVGIAGEANDVGEQHDDPLVAPRRDPVRRLELGHSGLGQDGVKQAIGAFALPLDLAPIGDFAVVPAFLLEAGSDARFQQNRIEWLRQIVLGAELDAPDGAAQLIERRDHDHRDVPQLRVHLHALQHLIAIEPRHHDVEEHEVDRLGSEPLERRQAIGRADRRVAEEVELLLEQVDVQRLVVHDQDSRTSRHRSFPAQSCSVPPRIRPSFSNRSVSSIGLAR